MNHPELKRSGYFVKFSQKIYCHPETLKKMEIKKMNFKPIGDRVIVKRCEEEKKIGNIITLNPEPSQFFEVMAISETVYDETALNVGDIVLIPKYGYNTVELEGIVYAIVKIEDVMAVRS